MADILDPPNPDPIPTPELRQTRKGYVTCDHCGCILTQGGEVFKMSAEAKKQNRHAETIVEMEATIATLRAEVEQLKAVPVPIGGSSGESPAKKFSIL